MPFIGRDWRSPGEAWVKTDEGSWEKLKILETSSINRNLHHDQSGFQSSGDSSTESDSDTESSGEEVLVGGSNESVALGTSPDSVKSLPTRCRADSGNSESGQETRSNSASPLPGLSMATGQTPYCHITLKSTKEVAGYNTISEAFYRLDFSNAIRDIRRFNYVCKLLHLLINQNLTSLSGCATKVLFNMLEQVAWQVASNQQNIHVLHTLLYDLKKIMKKYYCWGRPLGSTILWEQHLQTVEKICQMANTIEIKEPSSDGTKRLTDLPEELIREILLRLSDYKDLMSSGQAYEMMDSLLDEQHIWRQLCKYHFSRTQVRQVTGQFTSAEGSVDWEQVFHFLRRKFGLKEEYADTLYLCRHCRCLFWKSFGHPCVVVDEAAVDEPSSKTSDLDANNGNEGAVPVVKAFVEQSVREHIPVPPEAFLNFFSL